MWCWRRILRVPWTARSNQSILKEIGPEYSLEGLMLKLKLQYFGHLMKRTDSFEKTMMLGNTEGRRKGDDREWDGRWHLLTQWTWVWINSGRWWWTGRPGVLQSMGSQRVRHDWATELNWLKHGSWINAKSSGWEVCLGKGYARSLQVSPHRWLLVTEEKRGLYTGITCTPVRHHLGWLGHALDRWGRQRSPDVMRWEVWT